MNPDPMARLLEAEAEARADIARCEAQARARVDAARAQARAIAAAADRRIGRFHLRCAAANRRRTEAVHREEETALAQAGIGPAPDVLERALRRLAAELTGGRHE